MKRLLDVRKTRRTWAKGPASLVLRDRITSVSSHPAASRIRVEPVFDAMKWTNATDQQMDGNKIAEIFLSVIKRLTRCWDQSVGPAWDRCNFHRDTT